MNRNEIEDMRLGQVLDHLASLDFIAVPNVCELKLQDRQIQKCIQTLHRDNPIECKSERVNAAGGDFLLDLKTASVIRKLERTSIVTSYCDII